MNFLDFLKKNENARKIFGKAELKIIEKQISGIDLTQSEKNRLSRDVRRKLKFMRDISIFSNEFDLKKGALVRERIDYALELIKKDILFHKIKRIVLFGSTAGSERTSHSDIDIAVEFTSSEPKEATKFRSRISGNFDEKMDIQVYNILPEKIKKEIDSKGKELYQKRGNGKEL